MHDVECNLLQFICIWRTPSGMPASRAPRARDHPVPAALQDAPAGTCIIALDCSAAKLASLEGLPLANEGYEMAVRPDGISIRAIAPAGIFYGMQSLLQLLPAARDPAAVPAPIVLPSISVSPRTGTSCTQAALQLLLASCFSFHAATQSSTAGHPVPSVAVLRINMTSVASFRRTHLREADVNKHRLPHRSWTRRASCGAVCCWTAGATSSRCPS